jgi:hypothetical protein
MQQFDELELQDSPVAVPETGYPAKAASCDFSDVMEIVEDTDETVTIRIDKRELSSRIVGYKSIAKDGKVSNLKFGLKIDDAKDLFPITQDVLHKGVAKRVTFHMGGGQSSMFWTAKPMSARVLTTEEVAANDAATAAANS